MSDFNLTFSAEEVAPEPSFSDNPSVWIGFGPRKDGSIEAGEDRRVLIGQSVIGQVAGFAVEHSEGIAFDWAKTQRDRDGNLKYPEGKVAYLKLREPDGTDQMITLSLTDLHRRVRQIHPFGVADRLKITYEKDRPTDFGAMKVFDVRIKRANATPEERQGWLASTDIKREPVDPRAGLADGDAEAAF